MRAARSVAGQRSAHAATTITSQLRSPARQELDGADGKPEIARQVYLCKIDNLVAAAEHSNQPPQPLETDVAAFGDSAALFDIAQRLDLVKSDTPREAGGLMSWAASKME
jgi:hypothetical protein